jgi:MFS family permease
LLLWATAALLVATDAVALPYAATLAADPWAATTLLAATPAGAAVGALLVARLPVGRQIRLIFPLAFASTLPMLATAIEPPLAMAALLWFITGLCQGYVVTLMALSMQLTPEQRRGRVFGIAGAGFNGMAIVGLVGLGAIATATTPAAALVLAGALGLLVIALAALFWPRRDVRSAVRVSYGATTRSL